MHCIASCCCVSYCILSASVVVCVLAMHLCRCTVRTTGSHRLTGSVMANRPPAPLPHAKPTLKLASQHKDYSLSGSYEDPRQWVIPMYQQCPIDSAPAPVKAPVVADTIGGKLEIPALPRSSPPSAADYAIVRAKAEPSIGNVTTRAGSLSLPGSPVNGAVSSKGTEKKRSQTLVLDKGKPSASLGLSLALGKADTRKQEGRPSPSVHTVYIQCTYIASQVHES